MTVNNSPPRRGIDAYGRSHRVELVTSAKNTRLKEIRKLAQKSYRDETGLCLVEGIQPCLRAIENGHDVELFIYSPEILRSEAALAMVSDLEKRNTSILRVSKDAFASLSLRDNPMGIALVAKMRPTALSQVELRRDSILTALFNVKSPGNLGTIVRTVDSIGGAGVVLVGQTADPYDPLCIKASVGTVFNVPIIKVASADDFLTWCHSRQVALITTSAQAKVDLAGAAFSYPCAVLMGSEGPGLPEDVLSAGRWSVRIPMYGQASSLNLAVATGIILYEVKKQQTCQ